MNGDNLTYGSYLKVDELLELQKLQSEPHEHDEMLFIIIHQTYELWFKQIIHEFSKLRLELQNGNTWNSIKTMRRILTIMKTLVSQVDILETMTPLEFNNFRGFLRNSSGFQSIQFRKVEILCGIRTDLMFTAYEDQPDKVTELKSLMEEPTLWESYIAYLNKHGHSAHAERSNDRGLLYSPSETNQSVLLSVMKTSPELALVSELMVDFDEGLQEWRYRHVKMVERTIGSKKGTGGSEGVNYLKSTVGHAIFPDLWAIRSKF